MMTIRTLFFAHLRDIAGADEKNYEIPESTTVEQLAAHLATTDLRFNDLLRYARPAINSEWATGSSRLKDGDEVAFLPPSSGG
jgi:molybdopterin converting factor subunit 1